MKRKDWVVYRVVRKVIVNHKATGLKFRRRRIQAGWSYRQAGILCGCSGAYLFDLEHGSRPWTPARFAQYVEAISTKGKDHESATNVPVTAG